MEISNTGYYLYRVVIAVDNVYMSIINTVLYNCWYYFGKLFLKDVMSNHDEMI